MVHNVIGQYIFVTLNITVLTKKAFYLMSFSISNMICQTFSLCIICARSGHSLIVADGKNISPRSCHRSTISGLESSLSQETKGPEQLLDSPTRLLGLPVVAGLGCAVENFGEDACWPGTGSIRT